MAIAASSQVIPAIDLDPFSDAFLSDPYSYHGLLRDTGPVVWIKSVGAYGLARFADVSAALRDHVSFCSGRGAGLSDFAKEEPWREPSLLVEADPPFHDRTRQLMNRIVSLKSLKAVRPEWQRTAETLVRDCVARKRFDAVTDLAEVLPMEVFPDLIGVMREGREQLLLYAAATFNASGPRNAIFEESSHQARHAISWVANACKRENLDTGGWGMAVYEAADRGECTQAEAERLVRSFLSAGVDTTINGIGNMILAFATFPEQWAKLRSNPVLLKRAFEETLRWDSAVQSYFRTTMRDIDISGVTIPRDSKVMLFIGAANRDPRRWGDDGHLFHIDRATSGHVGFGYGIHQCLGQMVARMEAEIVLAALVSQIAEIKLAGEPRRRLNNALHAIASVPVEIEVD